MGGSIGGGAGSEVLEGCHSTQDAAPKSTADSAA